MPIPSRNIARVVLVTAGLLLVPLVAMRFTGEVNWTLADFVVAGALLGGTGLTYEFVASRTDRAAYRLAAGAALGTGLFLIWANLAVGLIGSENNPINLMYIGVLAVGLIGAALARLEPRGMARALLATAAAQAVVPAIALTVWNPARAEGLAEVLAVNAFFVALWVGSALLFARADARLEA